VIGQTVSHYEITSELGRGGMGVVYAANDLNLGRPVAIKFCPEAASDDAARQRFAREARAASALNHPNVAQVYDYGEGPNRVPFLVMELVDGESLGQWISRGPLPQEECFRIARCAGEALGEAHTNGIVHRDIKPSNICVSSRGEVKVLDFGLARWVAKAGVSTVNASTVELTGATAAGMAVGTPAYMSPEQAKGRPADARSDLFSLGAVLYECLTGKRAFPGTTAMEVLAQVLEGRPAPPSSIRRDLPSGWDRIISRLMAKDASQRYPNAAGFLRDLETLSQVDPNALRKRRITIWLAAAGVLAAAVVWLIARPGQYKPPPEALRWYEEGMRAIRNGTYLKASRSLQRTVELDPGFAMAHARLAEAWLELDDYDQARAEILRARPPDEGSAHLNGNDLATMEAIQFALTGEHEKSIGKYKELAGNAKGPDKVWAQLDLGRAYERKEDTLAAIDAYEKAAKADSQCAPAWLHLGSLYSRQQKYGEADAALAKAQSLYLASSDIEGVTEADYVRGTSLGRRGKPDESEAVLRQALARAGTVGSVQQQVKILMQLSFLHIGLGLFEAGQKEADQAVADARAHGIEGLSARSLVTLGNTYRQRSKVPEAERSYEEALRAARRMKSARSEAFALVNRGSLRSERGELDSASEDLSAALNFYRTGGYSKEALSAALLLARVQRNRGEAESSLAAFHDLQKLAEQSPNPQDRALAAEGTGSILMLTEHYRAALDQFEMSQKLFEEAKSAHGVPQALANQAAMRWRLGDYEGAQSLSEQAAQRARQGRLTSVLADLAQESAERALSQGRVAEARHKVSEAVELARSEGEQPGIETTRILVLADARSGSASAARPCAELEAAAVREKNPWELAQVQLVCAEAALAAGDRPHAQQLSQAAQQFFARTGQLDSGWRAWLLLARSNTKDKSAIQKAAAVRAELEKQWGPDDVRRYLARPDIRNSQKLLVEMQGGLR
jgi:serine/threonine protein kinase